MDAEKRGTESTAQIMIDLSVTICYCKFTEYQFWQTDQILIQIKKFLGVSPLISLDEKVIE